MLVHSYLYYHLDTEIVSDLTWQNWAEELTELQKEYRMLHGDTNIKFYDEAFSDWDGTTGMHLPQDGWVAGAANRLLRYKDKYE